MERTHTTDYVGLFSLMHQLRKRGELHLEVEEPQHTCEGCSGWDTCPGECDDNGRAGV